MSAVTFSESMPDPLEPMKPMRKSRTKVVVHGDFLQKREVEEDKSFRGRVRTQATNFTNSMYLANFIVVVVFIDAYCTCRDIDSRARNQQTPPTFRALSDLCLVVYTAELLLHFLLRGVAVLKDWMICMDLAIILCGYIEMVLGFVAEGLSVVGISIVRALRLVRIFRLIRLLRKIRTLRELHKLATMMATCAKTLVWSFLLCFLVMTVWSMLMVETVHPLLLELQDQFGTFSDCKGCSRAMSSVMDANLLLFKTVIAGDSWGEIAVPVIEQYPATAVIFMGSLLTLVFGVLNLIVAVVVDTFADARLSDVKNLAEEIEDEIANDRKMLAKVFARIDSDGSGQLTLEELIEGAQSDSDFQSRLRVMDIDEHDLQILFEMIDTDQSGTIEAAEFIGPLSRWSHDSKTAPRFIKYNMLQTMQMQEDLYDMCSDCFKHLALAVDNVSLELRKLKHQGHERKMSEASDASEEQEDEEKAKEEEEEAKLGPKNHSQQPHFEEDAVEMQVPPLPDQELRNDLEHVLQMRPSRHTSLLVDNNQHVEQMLQSAVAKLEHSLHKMERLAAAADIMVRKWREVPDRTRSARAQSTSMAKSDVFWAMYMDREHIRERRLRKKKEGKDRSSRLSAFSQPTGSLSSGSQKDMDEVSAADDFEVAHGESARLEDPKLL